MRPKHQHTVAHGFEYAFKLGSLLCRRAHMVFNIFGHAVHGFCQRRKFLAGNTAQAALKIAQRYGLDHRNHLRKRIAQSAGKQPRKDQ